MDLAVNNLQVLMCHKSKAKQTKPNYSAGVLKSTDGISVELKTHDNVYPGYDTKPFDGKILAL